MEQKHKYKVDGCFLWSTGSWDVLAVYPESTNSEGSYLDPVVADIIDRHNSAARKAGHSFIAPTRNQLAGARKFKSGLGVPLRRTAPTGDDDEGTFQPIRQRDRAAGSGSASHSRLGTTIRSSSGSSLLPKAQSSGDSSMVKVAASKGSSSVRSSVSGSGEDTSG